MLTLSPSAGLEPATPLLVGPSPTECPICLDEYGPGRRGKRLACRHACCSRCLARMVLVMRCPGDAATDTPGGDHGDGDAAGGPERESSPGNRRRPAPARSTDWPAGGGGGAVRSAIPCPWCRRLTLLPRGASVSQLPDGGEGTTTSPSSSPSSPSSPTSPPLSPVFVRLLPGDGGTCLLPRCTREEGEEGPAPSSPAGDRRPPSLSPPPAVPTWRAAPVSPEGDVWGGDGGGEEGGYRYRKAWTRVCVAVIFSLGVLLVTYAITHSLSCSSSAFTMIRCGG